MVVLWVAGRHFSRPINRQSHRLHLLFHVSDVGVCPLCWWHFIGDGGIFCWHAVGIPTHGHQHVISLHAQMSCHDVVDGVITYMAHVQFARWIGQHRTCIKFGLYLACSIFCIFNDSVDILFVPLLLHLIFYQAMIIKLHQTSISSKYCRCYSWCNPNTSYISK